MPTFTIEAEKDGQTFTLEIEGDRPPTAVEAQNLLDRGLAEGKLTAEPSPTQPLIEMPRPLDTVTPGSGAPQGELTSPNIPIVGGIQTPFLSPDPAPDVTPVSPLEALKGAFSGAQRLPFQAPDPIGPQEPEGLDPTNMLKEIEEDVLSNPEVQLAAGATIGGIVGTPFLGTLAGTMIARVIQQINNGEFSAENLKEQAINETVSQAATAAITRGSLWALRAGLRMTQPVIRSVMNELGERARGLGDRIMQPLPTRGVKAARDAMKAQMQQAGFADLTPVNSFIQKMPADDRETFLRFMRRILPATGRHLEVIGNMNTKLMQKLGFRVKSVPLIFLERMRQKVGREVRRLERNPGQELQAGLPANFRSTLVQYRNTIDDMIDTTMKKAGLGTGVIRKAREEHFKRVSADAIEGMRDRFFKSQGSVMQLDFDGFRNAVNQAAQRRGGIVGRALKNRVNNERWLKEVNDMQKFMGGIQFASGVGPFVLKFPVIARTVQKLSQIMADETKMNIFKRAIKQAGRKFVFKDRVIPLNIVQTAIAATETGLDDQMRALGLGLTKKMKEAQESEMLESIKKDALTMPLPIP